MLDLWLVVVHRFLDDLGICLPYRKSTTIASASAADSYCFPGPLWFCPSPKQEEWPILTLRATLPSQYDNITVYLTVLYTAFLVLLSWNSCVFHVCSQLQHLAQQFLASLFVANFSSTALGWCYLLLYFCWRPDVDSLLLEKTDKYLVHPHLKHPSAACTRPWPRMFFL